jgi:hypothetical protein
MRTYDAEMTLIIMNTRPEYFEEKEVPTYEYVNGRFGQERIETGIAKVSKATDILDTAHAFEIKYGRENAINYINTAMKKGA